MPGLPGMKRQWIGCFINGNLAVKWEFSGLMGIYRLNENLSVRLKALQLYIYWGALKGLNYIA